MAREMAADQDRAIKQQEQAREQAKLDLDRSKTNYEIGKPVEVATVPTIVVGPLGIPKVVNVPIHAPPVTDPVTGKVTFPVPPPPSGSSANPPDISNIPSSVTGEEFVQRAKQSGYSPFVLDLASKVADYKLDPTKLVSLKENERGNVIRLARPHQS